MRRLTTALRLAGCTGLVIALGLAGRTAEAAIRDPNGNPLPDSLTMAVDPGTGEPKTVWLAHQGCRPREMPGPGGSTNREAVWPSPIKFMEPFFYAMKTVGPDLVPYYLLVKSSPDGDKIRDFVGWVDARHLVESYNALSDPATRMVRKAMIINAPKANKSGGTTAIEQGVTLRLAPFAGGPASGGMIRMFSLFFVYAETETELLLGIRPQFSTFPDPDEPSKIVMGWAPKERLCQWTTREAFEWAPYLAAAPRHKPGRIYRTAQDALDAIEGKTVKPLMEESKDRGGTYGVEWPVDQMRYPLLTWDPDETVRRRLGDNEMYRVGVVGGFAGSGFNPQKFQEATDSMARQLKPEILFVIDETSSMKYLFPTVAQLVRQIVEGVSGKVAVAYYGDTYDAGRLPATPAPLQATSEKSAAAIAESVSTRQPQSGGDDPERVFYGIREAIQGAGFSEYARKIVIVLGDMGNKHVNGDPSADDLAALLVPSTAELPIEFYAIQVCDPDAAKNQPYGKRFQSEMRDIVDRVQRRAAAKYDPIALKNGGTRFSGTLSAYTDVKPGEPGKPRIVELVQKQYQSIVLQGRGTGTDVARFAVDFQTTIAPELVKILEDEYGYDINELRKIQGFQLFTYGYIWRENEDGQVQIRPRLLLNDAELQEFLKALGGLTMRAGAAKKPIPEFMKEEIAAQSGEGDPALLKKMSMNDVLFKKTGLQVLSPLLNKVLGDIEAGKFHTAFRKQELQEIARKHMKLQDMQKGVVYDYEAQEVNEAGLVYKRWFRRGQTAEKPRMFHLHADQIVKWYWVDITEEWP